MGIVFFVVGLGLVVADIGAGIPFLVFGGIFFLVSVSSARGRAKDGESDPHDE